MDADQNEISQFLRSFQDQFVSGKEICRRAGGKWRFREDPGWALPILRRMLESKLVETDIDGRFRLFQPAVSVAGPNRVIGARRRRLAGHFESDEALRWAVGLLLPQNFGAHEMRFAEGYEKTQARFDRRCGFI